MDRTDTIETKKNNASRLRTMVLPYWPVILLAAVFIAVWSAINLSTPFITRIMVDGIQNGALTAGDLIRCGAVYLILVLIAALVSRFMRQFLLDIGHKVAARLRERVFTQLTTLDSSFYINEQTGDIMARMTSDVTAVKDMVGQGLLHISRAAIVFTFAFPLLFWVEWRLALIVAILLPVMSAVVYAIMRQMRPRYQASQDQLSDISSFSQENFAGIRLVKGFGAEDRQNETFRDLNREYIRRNLKLARLESPAWPFMGFLFTLGMLLIVYVGGQRVIDGKLTLGVIVQFMQYLFFLQWPMMSLGWTLHLIVKGGISWKRLRYLMESPPAITDGPNRDATLGGDIEFRHVSLAFSGRTVLDDISLTIPEGQTVAITGPTGCGKTVLANLLIRRHDPTSGQVFIGLHDIRQIPLATLRDHVRVAPQEPFLFSQSLASNVALGLSGEATKANRSEPDATESDTPAPEAMERVRWATSVAHILDEIETFPNGFRTQLGERGLTLSGGQRQRSAIARAVIGNPDILILDDTLSAVDTQTEAGIIRNLQPVLRERTSIVIAHRVSTLRHADRILVMEDGRITQNGTHTELVAQPGYYRDLDTTQRLAAQLEAIE